MKQTLRLLLILSVISLLACLTPDSSWAQLATQKNADSSSAGPSLTEIMPRLDWNDVTQTIETSLQNDNKALQNALAQIKSTQARLNQNSLQALITTIKTVKDDTSSLVTRLQSYNSTISSVLEILGPKAETGGEDPSISRQRKETQKASRTVKALDIRARFYNLQARNMLSELGILSQKLQHETLSRRSASPLGLKYWQHITEELPLHPFSLTQNHTLKRGCLLALGSGLILFFTAISGLYLRHYFIMWLGRWIDPELLDARVAHRLIHCLCGLLLGGMAFLLWNGWSALFAANITETENMIGQTLPICAFILGAGLPLSHIMQGRSNYKACLLLTLAILCEALLKTLKLQDIPAHALIAFLEMLLSLLALGCCFSLVPPLAHKKSAPDTPSRTEIGASAAPETKASDFLTGWGRFLWTVLWIYTILTLGWILCGYTTLAFTANSALISFIYAAGNTGCFVGAWQALVTLLFSPHTITGRHLLTLGLTRKRLDFLNVLISAPGSLVFLMLFIALLTNEGDFTPVGIMNRLHHVFAGSTFHGVAVSPETLLGCLVLVVSAHYLIKGIRFWLDKKFFPTTTLTTGLKTSILSIFTYCSWIMAGLVLLSLIGVSVQNLTWVVSALSVGVGFGLQSIVKDFISGLILLAERPIEAGDVIEVGGNRGEVKRVNVRTTDIRLGDGSTLIVPNSQFITSNVKNASFGNVPAKLTLSFTLPVNSDLELVRTLILKTIDQQQNGILSHPAPGISLAALNDMTVTLTLSVYVATPGETSGVKTRLVNDIFTVCQKARIILTMC